MIGDGVVDFLQLIPSRSPCLLQSYRFRQDCAFVLTSSHSSIVLTQLTRLALRTPFLSDLLLQQGQTRVHHVALFVFRIAIRQLSSPACIKRGFYIPVCIASGKPRLLLLISIRHIVAENSFHFLYQLIRAAESPTRNADSYLRT